VIQEALAAPKRESVHNAPSELRDIVGGRPVIAGRHVLEPPPEPPFHSKEAAAIV